MSLLETSRPARPGWAADRAVWIDKLRGLAIMLMLLDHYLAVTDPGSIVRLSVTRWSLPLFMCASAAVWRPGIRQRRLLLLTVAAAVEVAAFAVLDLGNPGILVVYLVAIVPLSHFERASHHTFVIGVCGLVQALYLPIGWAGYEPGLVVLWWCLGRLGSYQVEALAVRLPAVFSVMGRRPLSWYCGHLLVLVVLVLGGVL